MNTGVEAGETAVKITRKWGLPKKRNKKKSAANHYISIKFSRANITIISSSTDPVSNNGLVPMPPDMIHNTL